MLLSFRGREWSHHLAKEVSLQTGQSFLLPSSVRHDQSKAELIFLIERFALVEVKRKCFGLVDIPVYDTNAGQVRTRVSIGSVRKMSLKSGLKTALERIQILAGIVLRPDRVIVTSLEEDKGEPFYELDIAIENINITLEDEGD